MAPPACRPIPCQSAAERLHAIHERPEDRTLTVAVIGHVDHGKTALVRALTGIETDRLKEERERGISIVLGFAPLVLDAGTIDLIDVPGHENFVRTMIAGAGGVDAVLLVVAANEGVKPQTVEHLAIARLLGVRRGLAVISKVDLADGRPAMEEAVALMARNRIVGPAIGASALTGEGVAEIRGALAVLTKGAPSPADCGFCHLPVDRVFSLPGHGTVVTGTLRRGPIAVGDTVAVVPGGLAARVRGLELHGRPVASAPPGRRVAVNLRGVARETVPRGSSLATPGSLRPATWLDVAVTALDAALIDGAELVLLTGTQETPALLRVLGKREVPPGTEAVAQLRCRRSVCAAAGDAFILRRASPPATLGGGRILDPASRRRRRDHALAAYLSGLVGATPEQVVAARLASGPAPVAELARLAGVAADRLDRSLRAARAIKFADGTIVAAAGLEPLLRRVLATLSGAARKPDTMRGLSPPALRAALPDIPGAVVDGLLGILLRKGLAERNGPLVRRPGAGGVTLSQREHGLAERLEAACRTGGLTPPAVATSGDRAMAAAVAYLVGSGRLVCAVDRVHKRRILFHRDAVAEARRRLARALETMPEGITVSEAGRLFGISRKFSIPLLEHFDATGATRRVGDRRVLAERRSTQIA